VFDSFHSPRSNSKPIHVRLVHPGVLVPGITLTLKTLGL
jgi:hypothetical protein